MSTTRHVVGYSKSTRAKCHAPGPCQNTPLPAGTLRYGQAVSSDVRETVTWCHWGCVTPQVLAALNASHEKDIDGFFSLKPADQAKIRLAISQGRIDPVDIPRTARLRAPVASTQSTSSASTPVVNNLKRTVAQAGLELTNRLQSSSAGVPSLTQCDEEDEVVEEEARDELYCEMSIQIAGVQYYSGLVGTGEEVGLIREPRNPYDKNAIKVENIGGVQVGHVPRNLAAKLAPLLDQCAVTVEGVMKQGNLSGSRGFQLSMSLKIYGPPDKRSELEPALIWATPGQRGFNSSRTTTGRSSTAGVSSMTSSIPSHSAANTDAMYKHQEALQKAAELRQVLNTLEKVDDEGRRTSLLDTLCSKDDVLTLPTHPDPPGIATGELFVDLLKHQSQALKWCIERENPILPKTESDKPVQFWQLRKRGQQPYYYNIATKTPQEVGPPLGRGALCADAMGLGKTLTMIALIIATKKEVDLGFSQSSLIVVPLSVLSNWEKQIADHCVPGTLSVCTYYGTNRNLSASKLQKHDVVITTYQTVVSECEEGAKAQSKKRKSDRTLFEVAWKRVILDEGHTIRNPKTKTAKSTVALNASRRWVLTGTPIINSPRDLGSILTFLKICQPLDNEDFYKRLLLRPLKNGEPSGADLLKALMSHVCIRRTKEMQDRFGKPLIELPPVEMIRVPVTLSDEARHLYDEVEKLSRKQLETFISQSGITAAVQSGALSMLTRLRQIALHPNLVPVTYLDELRSGKSRGNTSHRSIVLTPEEKTRLQELLAQAIEDSEECPICMDLLKEPRISTCGHMYCLACIMEVLSRDPKCPMDRRQLSMDDLLEPPAPSDLTQRFTTMENIDGYKTSSSAKIDQLVHLLKLTPFHEKSLVFSQFTSFLDKIGERLAEERIPFVRFDGQMSAKRRQEAIARFSVPLAGGAEAEGSDGTDNSGDSDFADNSQYPLSKKTKAKEKASIPDENPKVMLLSLKAGALGLNLTVANNVYLMDPWWQEGIESQAVDRVNRIGQTKPVHVYQLIADNTVESKVLDIQGKKKELIKQAFSGIKRTETQRQQREARLQDLIDLFGIQRQATDITVNH